MIANHLYSLPVCIFRRILFYKFVEPTENSLIRLTKPLMWPLSVYKQIMFKLFLHVRYNSINNSIIYKSHLLRKWLFNYMGRQIWRMEGCRMKSSRIFSLVPKNALKLSNHLFHFTRINHVPFNHVLKIMTLSEIVLLMWKGETLYSKIFLTHIYRFRIKIFICDALIKFLLTIFSTDF